MDVITPCFFSSPNFPFARYIEISPFGSISTREVFGHLTIHAAQFEHSLTKVGTSLISIASSGQAE